MPSWSRPVEGNRGPEETTAGIPDFLLYLDAGAGRQTAMTEVKTSWTYTRENIDFMLSWRNYNANGTVIWVNDRIPNRILKQVSPTT